MSVKTEILKFLEMNKGTHMSGEGIAHALGVSRSAVWKAIHSLESEGHLIEAVPNKGYMLLSESDMLTAEAISLNLRYNVPLTVLQETDSTNKRCIALALDGAVNGTTVVSDKQTGGRGRLGRSFYSPSGKGIYLSMVLKPDFDISKSVLITVASSVAVAKAIEKVCGITPEIKWVNDIYIEGKKVCGILCEAVTDFESGEITNVIPGIGINCREMDFPDEIKDTAGFIPGSYGRSDLAAEVINQMMEITKNISDRSFIDYYRSHSMITGKDIWVIKTGKEPVPAKAVGIDEDGGLMVEYEKEKAETLTTGEVSIRVR